VDDAVATIRLARPAAHNRIDPDDIPVLRAHLEAVRRTAGTRVLVITGSGGRSFSSRFTVDAITDRLDRSFEDLLDESSLRSRVLRERLTALRLRQR
jgi:enoyl-CoA hydratase/carnithine racemase